MTTWDCISGYTSASGETVGLTLHNRRGILEDCHLMLSTEDAVILATALLNAVESIRRKAKGGAGTHFLFGDPDAVPRL